MPHKLFLLLLSGILIQGMIGTSTDDDIGKPSDILVRQKRVISSVPGEDQRQMIRNFPYIAIVKYNNRINCVGSILSQRHVITVSLCVVFDISRYHIVTNTARADIGTSHSIVEIITHYGAHPERRTDGIALLTVQELFVFGAHCYAIQLYSGPLIPGTIGTVSGWGYNWRSDNRGTRYPTALRSIDVPILAHQDCVNRYQSENIQIFGDHICTYHPQKHCGHIDGGAPLVIHGRLAGVHLWSGPERTPSDPRYPDVFALLQHYEYHQWILENI